MILKVPSHDVLQSRDPFAYVYSSDETLRLMPRFQDMNLCAKSFIMYRYPVLYYDREIGRHLSTLIKRSLCKIGQSSHPLLA